MAYRYGMVDFGMWSSSASHSSSSKFVVVAKITKLIPVQQALHIVY